MQTECRPHRIGRLHARSPSRDVHGPANPAKALLDNVVSLRRLASTSDGPNHRGPPLCTDLTHSLHRDGMARSWGERGRLFQATGWLGDVLVDQPVIIEKITSVALNAYSRALKRHIINEIEKSFAALTGGRSRQDRLSNDFERKAATAEAGLPHVIGVWHAPYCAISNPRDNAGAAKASRCGRLQRLSLRARTRMEILVQRRPQTARTNVRILRVEAPE
jgi:hypothetical protein